MLKDQELEQLLAINLGRHIREKRKELGINQAEAGYRTNIDEKNFSKHEQGTRIPKIKTLYRIREKLDISIDQVIDETMSIVGEKDDQPDE